MEPEGATAQSDDRPRWLTLLIFLFVGPPIGAFTALAIILVGGVVEARSASGVADALAFTAFILPLAIVFGYVIGAVPALITAVAAIVLQPRLRARSYVGAVALTGWLTVTVPAVPGSGWNAPVLGLIGAIPAACCAWLTQPSPRQVPL